MTPVQMDPDVRPCGALKEKGNPRTLETYRFVCDLPAGHAGSHEGTVEGGTVRLGWPNDQVKVA